MVTTQTENNALFGESSDSSPQLSRPGRRAPASGLWSDRALLQEMISHSPLALYVVDADGVVKLWNPGAEHLYGWSEHEVLGRRLPVVGADYQREFDRIRQRALKGTPLVEFETVREHKDGHPIDVLISTVPLLDDDGRIQVVLGVSQDITERKQAEAKLQHLARYDELTGLDNRYWFFERVAHLLKSGRRPAGLVYLDLDQFKQINDTYGHEGGDQLLRIFGRRLRGAVRPTDVVGRLGGDEFAAFIRGVGEHGVRTVVERIFEAVRAPFYVGGRSFTVRASAGGVLCDASSELSDVVRAADAALYQAKRGRRGGLCIYDAELHEAIVSRVNLETRVRGAAAAGEMTLHYQPVVESAEEGLVGFEALVRWNHPELGLLQPTTFIGAAERTGEIVPLGSWVLQTACRQLREWDREFPSENPIEMSVNVSAQQLVDPGFLDDVIDALIRNDLAPRRLQLEMTESAFATEEIRDVLEQLRDLGVSLAIDDFGTGYSSLIALRRFPFTTLKIDQSFVSGIASSDEDRALVLATISLAETFGLTSIAEGIETQEQFDFLRLNGCDRSQGFFIGRPLPADAIEATWFSSRARAAG